MTKRRKNGEGSIQKLPNGKYRMKKQVGFLPNGRPRILTVTGTTAPDCIHKMNLKEKDFENDHPLLMGEKSIKKVTVKQLCEQHLDYDMSYDHLKPSSSNRREDTIRNQIGKYPIGNYQAVTVKSQDVVTHIDELIKKGINVSSVEKAYNVINAAYKWAGAQNYLCDNPCTSVHDMVKNRLSKLKVKNSSNGVVRILSDKQVKLLEDYGKKAKERFKPYRYHSVLGMLFMLHTGLRVGELCALRWRDYNEKNGVITINKTRNKIRLYNPKSEKNTYTSNENAAKNWHSRTIALRTEAINDLKEIRRISTKDGPDDYIILSRSGTPTDSRQYYPRINDYYQEAGMPEGITGAHILRRTIATKMYKEGARVEDIAAYLGDRPETILKHYICLSEQIISEDEVINVIKYPVQNVDAIN